MIFSKKHYHSGMAGAPTISGTAGSGIGFLDTMLITGFNPRTVVTLNRTGTVGTVVTSGSHGYLPGEIVAISGVNETDWNGEYIVATVVDTTTITITVPDTLPSSGTPVTTITIKHPPISTYWSKVLSGTNKAIYRSTDPTGTQWYLRVDDSNAKYMTVTMLEGYTTIDTGLLNTYNTYWGKSWTADSTVRPWRIVGDSKRFYLGILWTTSAVQVNANAKDWYFFGDILPVKAGDNYHCGIIGTALYPINSAPSEQGSANHNSFIRSDGSVVEAYLLRAYGQRGPQVGFGRYSTFPTSRMGYDGAGVYPNPPDSGTYIQSQIMAYQGGIRGFMPGMHPPLSNIQHQLADGDTSIIKAGKTYMYIRMYGSNSYPGGLFLEITPTIPWSIE